MLGALAAEELIVFDFLMRQGEEFEVWAAVVSGGVENARLMTQIRTA